MAAPWWRPVAAIQVRPARAPGRSWATAVSVPAVGLALAAAAGCDREVDARYGAVRGASINGVGAFVQLLRDTGHDVTAWDALPARIDPEITTLVVFDHSFMGLDPAAVDLLFSFCYRNTPVPRTLLLVLRDSDCVIDYLRDLLSRDDLDPARRTRAEALLQHAGRALTDATSAPRARSTGFFDGLAPVDRTPPQAEGPPPSAAPGPGGSRVRLPATPMVEVRLRERPGVPERRVIARWPLHRRLTFVLPVGKRPLVTSDSRFENLWETGNDGLLVSRRYRDATTLALASATPLLNGGLVDAGNRRLAEDIAALLPTTGRVLVAGSARVVADGDADRPPAQAAVWRLLQIQPLPWVVGQSLVALTLLCWCTFPIFGRPRRSSPAQGQDFGLHVEALASLFVRSRVAGVAFARGRLDAWRKAARSATRPAAGRATAPFRWSDR